MAVLVDTSKYKAVHGKEPSEYGNWRFKIGKKEVILTGNYDICRKEAIDKSSKIKYIARIYLLA